MKHSTKNSARNHAGNHHPQGIFHNIQMCIEKFDGAERDTWQKPDEVIASLVLPSTAVIVEIGAGTGYFTTRLAAHVTHGKVVAVDTAPNMVLHLKKRVADAGLMHVDVHLAESGTEVSLSEKADLILCVDSYHHISNRIRYFSHLQEYLSWGGKVAIIDRPASSPVCPPHGHQTSPELVVEEMGKAGYTLLQTLDFLLPHQFYLIFKSEK